MKRIIVLICVCFSSFYTIAQSNPVNPDTSRFVNYSAKILWVKDVGDSLSALVSNTDDRIFVASKYGNIFCFDFSGRLIWMHDVKRSILGNPIDSKGNLIISTLSGDLISLNDSTGEVIQSIGLDEPLTSPLIENSTPNNGQQTEAVIAGSIKGSIYCYDINSFEMIWENHSAKGKIISKPLAIDNKIIFTSNDGFLYCIDSRSGMLIWKWTDPKNKNISLADCSPITDGRNVFICSTHNFLYSIDLMLGRTKWLNDYYDCNSSLMISDNKKFLFVKSVKDNFYVVSAINGRPFRKLDMDFGEDSTKNAFLEWKGKELLSTGYGKVYLVESDLKWKPLFFLGDGVVQNIVHLKDDIFVASSVSGRVVEFKVE
ncbi:MAG: PQQ-binding-like beta-propeller repeat protein [Ignavibacteriaceae bacterium]